MSTTSKRLIDYWHQHSYFDFYAIWNWQEEAFRRREETNKSFRKRGEIFSGGQLWLWAARRWRRCCLPRRRRRAWKQSGRNSPEAELAASFCCGSRWAGAGASPSLSPPHWSPRCGAFPPPTADWPAAAPGTCRGNSPARNCCTAASAAFWRGARRSGCRCKVSSAAPQWWLNAAGNVAGCSS